MKDVRRVYRILHGAGCLTTELQVWWRKANENHCLRVYWSNWEYMDLSWARGPFVGILCWTGQQCSVNKATWSWQRRRSSAKRPLLVAPASHGDTCACLSNCKPFRNASNEAMFKADLDKPLPQLKIKTLPCDHGPFSNPTRARWRQCPPVPRDPRETLQGSAFRGSASNPTHQNASNVGSKGEKPSKAKFTLSRNYMKRHHPGCNTKK